VRVLSGERRTIQRALGDHWSAERTGRAGLVVPQDDTTLFRLRGLQESGQDICGTSRRKWHQERHIFEDCAGAGAVAKAANAVSRARLVIFSITLLQLLLH
jgi:hypothetical protein